MMQFIDIKKTKKLVIKSLLDYFNFGESNINLLWAVFKQIHTNISQYKIKKANQ